MTKIDDLVLTAASFLPHFILFFPLPLWSIPAQTGVYSQQVLLEKVVLEESLHLLVSRQVWSLAILLNTCILAAAGSFTFCGCFETGLPHFPVAMFWEIPFSQGHQMSHCFSSVTFPTDSWHCSGSIDASEFVTTWSLFWDCGDTISPRLATDATHRFLLLWRNLGDQEYTAISVIFYSSMYSW